MKNRLESNFRVLNFRNILFAILISSPFLVLSDDAFRNIYNSFRHHSKATLKNSTETFLSTMDMTHEMVKSGFQFTEEGVKKFLTEVEATALKQKAQKIIERHNGNIADIEIFIDLLKENLSLILKNYPNDKVNIDRISEELSYYLLAKNILEGKNL
jgi:hypothetical protein